MHTCTHMHTHIHPNTCTNTSTHAHSHKINNTLPYQLTQHVGTDVKSHPDMAIVCKTFSAQSWPTSTHPHTKRMTVFISTNKLWYRLLLLHSQLYLWGSLFWVRFLRMWLFFNPTRRQSHYVFVDSVPGCLFVADIHPSRTWMSEIFESMWWNICVHRLDLGLYSHPKQFQQTGVRQNVYTKGKIPSTGGSEEVWICDTASHRTASPTLYPLNYSSPNTDFIININEDKNAYPIGVWH